MLLLFLAGGSAAPAPLIPPSGVTRPTPSKRGPEPESEDEEIMAIIAAMRGTLRWGGTFVYRDIDADGITWVEGRAAISVPAYVSRNAERGLRYYEDGKGGDGLVAATISDARDMARGTVSEPKLRRIGPWIARHMVDLDAPPNSKPSHPRYPGPGLVAMLLWGAGPDKEGARRTMEWAERKVAALDRMKRG